MTWEYRVVKHTDEDENFVWFAIYEVYSKDTKIDWTVDRKAPTGRSPDELRSDLNMMLKALDCPILERKGDTLVEVSDDNSEIKQRIERHKKWRRDRLEKDYIGPPALWSDVDWLIDELERQLERNETILGRNNDLNEEVEQLRKDSEFAY